MHLFRAAAMAVLAFVLAADAGDGDTEYQFQIPLSHKLTDRLTSLEYLGYNKSTDEDFSTYYLGLPGLDYKVNAWLRLRAVWYTRFTDHADKPDAIELRPSVGFKANAPAERMHFYNLTRYEARAIQDRADDTWNHSSRIRSRFGVDVPLAPREREWQPGTWYATADIEPYYEIEEKLVSPVSARIGIVRVLNENMQAEFYYAPQYTRSRSDTPFEETGSIFQLTLKIGFQKGLIRREHIEVSDN